VVGLISTSEPDDARITRTASLTMSWSASWESSVEWMTLLTWYSRLRRSGDSLGLESSSLKQ
jgi:hypothetical protein